MIDIDNLFCYITFSEIIVGGIIGFIASFFVGTDSKIFNNFIIRFIVYIIAGMAGSQLGHFLFTTSSSILSFIISIFGAVVILVIIAFIFKKR